MTTAKPRKPRPLPAAANASADPKRAVLEAALPRIPREGFSERTLKESANEAGVTTTDVARLFPNGAQDLVAEFSAWADDEMERTLKTAKLAEMKIRDRIKAAVNDRIAALRPHKEAARRAAAFLTLPPNAALAATLLYRTVDGMWRAVGDTSTDFNFYTKRAILAGVYSSTMLRWFTDDSEDEKATFEFLDARIENVMQFEKFKAETLSKLPSMSDLFSRFSGRNSASAR
ncbi:MAG TPA: COQ9 family protein [Rhizomicrobium sp.]|jgi:ubiquinone biosynthesis protein COQ9